MRTMYVLLAVAGCTTTLDESALSNSYDLTSDPWPALDRIEREGPPRYTSRIHSCPKMRYLTLGNVLASRGVDLAATGALSAGAIYRASAGSLAAPNYAQRVRENVELGL